MAREEQVREVMEAMDRLPLDGNHALLIGNVFGSLAFMAERVGNMMPTRVYPEVLDGAYTSRILIERPSGKYAVTVERLESHDAPE